MKKKILILGSEGQVGDHLVNFFNNKKNYEVIRFDIVMGNSYDLRKFNNKDLEIQIKKSDFIFFLAFDVGGSRYLKKNQKTYNFLINNLMIMVNVFSVIKKYNKKFIFTSTQMSNMNYSTYGLLKRLGEEVTKSLNGVYVKLWNIYGIEKDFIKSLSHDVITDFILMGLKDKKINMITNGNESREFLYAEDCSMGLFTIMNRFNFLFKQKTELHLSTGKKTKVIEIAKIIKKILSKKKINIRIKPSLKKDDVQNNAKNKANKYLHKHFKPRVNLEQGIEKIINYYLKEKYN